VAAEIEAKVRAKLGIDGESAEAQAPSPPQQQAA